MPNDVRAAINALVSPVVAKLKKKFCQTPKRYLFNCPADIFTRWHRDALYFVVVMRTARRPPATFEMHAARMEYAGAGKFNLAVPMRRGWNTFKRRATP